MSVVFTGTFQGSFISNGQAKFIALPSGVDNMYVRNRTVSYATGAGTGAEFFWQRGMTDGRGTVYLKTATTQALQVGQIAANSGFFVTPDTGNQTPGPSLALTGITGANPPVVNTANTTSLVNGDVVRIINTVGALQLGGIDFTIGAISAGVSFTLAYMAAIVAANPGAGFFRKIPFSPRFYPARRTISKISQATQAIVTLTVTHGYYIGQKIRFIIPTVNATSFGMTALDQVEATIVNIGAADTDGVTNTITVDVDTTGMTAFAWPLTAAGGFTPPQTIPVGINTAYANNPQFMTPPVLAQNPFNDATLNVSQSGMILMAGTSSPAGANLDVIDWIAGKSFNT